MKNKFFVGSGVMFLCLFAACLLNLLVMSLVFKLVDLFTAAENVILGIDDGERYNIKDVNRKVKELAEKYDFQIDTEKKIYERREKEERKVLQ